MSQREAASGRANEPAGSSPRIDDLLGRMAARDKVGQMVIGLNHPHAADAPDIESLIRADHIGSVRSCGYRSLDPYRAATRNNAFQRAAAETGLGVPLLNGGDFEQGLASQMARGVTGLPQQLGIAAIADPEAADRAAWIAGREARALGFHWTFSPVADVNVNSANPVIGVRSFGSDPDTVAALTVSQVRGYRRAGVLSTAKHFPGHGDTTVDSHRGLPTISCDLKTLETIHLTPFVAAIREGVDAIMTAHIVVPALDPDRPATLSPRILTALLRHEMGFDGIIVTDLMSMDGIAARWGPEEAAIMAVQAGADVVIPGDSAEAHLRAIDALLQATRSGIISADRLDASVRRVLAAKHKVGLFDSPYVDPQSGTEAAGSADNLAMAEELAHASITLVKNDGVLPFDPHRPEPTLVAGVTNIDVFGGPPVSHVPLVSQLVGRASVGDVVSWQSGTEEPTEGEIREAIARAQQADRVIVLTYTRGVLPAGQVELVKALLATERPLAAVATGTPYDIVHYPDVTAYVACYAHSFVPAHLASPPVLAGAINVLFGAESLGRLPVQISGQYPLGYGIGY